MSNHRAIAGASATIRHLLRDRMVLPVGMSRLPITVATPRAETQNPEPTEPARINLFLYRVAEDGNLKNQDIPGRGHPASYGTPPLSLDLFYLLSAYGSNPDADGNVADETLAQQLLGNAMLVLHECPIITENIEDTHGEPVLDECLRGEAENLRVSLDPLGLEDLSKLWTALTLPFRLSAGYKVTVVQIESRRPGRRALPVKTRRVHLAAARPPAITALYRTPAASELVGDARLALGQEMTIEGRHLTARKTYVRIGALEPIRVEPDDDHSLRIVVPDANYPIDGDHASSRPIDPGGTLQPGPHPVQVLTLHDTEAVEGALGSGEFKEDHKTLRSNQAVFMLVPEISSISPTEGKASDTSLTVRGRRLFGHGLETQLLFGDTSISVPAEGQTDTALVMNLASLATSLPPPPLVGRAYRLRVVVNGAESLEETFNFTVRP